MQGRELEAKRSRIDPADGRKVFRRNQSLVERRDSRAEKGTGRVPKRGPRMCKGLEANESIKCWGWGLAGNGRPMGMLGPRGRERRWEARPSWEARPWWEAGH